MSQFIGKSGTNNIVHLTTGTRDVSSQSPGTDTIFHSAMPNIVVLQQVNQASQGSVGGYQIFSFQADLLATWDAQGRVYFIEITHANGVKRLLGGYSTLESGYIQSQGIGSSLDPGLANVRYLQEQSQDLYSHQMWLSNAYGTNYDRAQSTRMQNALWLLTSAVAYSAPGGPLAYQTAAARFSSADVLSKSQVSIGGNQKTHLAIKTSRDQVNVGTMGQYSLVSNYSTDVTDPNSTDSTATRLSSLSINKVYGTTSIYSDSQVSGVRQLLTNLTFNGSSFSYTPIFSSTGEIKISNSDFLIGGVDLRSQGFGIITQQSTVNPSLRSNLSLGSQTNTPNLTSAQMDQGFNVQYVPAYSSWELNGNIPEIRAGGQVIWGPNNIPLKFFFQSTVNIPQYSRVIQESVPAGPQLLYTLQTGASAGAITVVISYDTSTTDLFYPTACFAFVPAPYTANAKFPKLSGGQFTSVGKNYSLLNLPVGTYVPIYHSYSSKHKYTIYIRNAGNGNLEIWDSIHAPAGVLYTRGTFTSPDFTLRLARLT